MYYTEMIYIHIYTHTHMYIKCVQIPELRRVTCIHSRHERINDLLVNGFSQMTVDEFLPTESDKEGEERGVSAVFFLNGLARAAVDEFLSRRSYAHVYIQYIYYSYIYSIFIYT